MNIYVDMLLEGSHRKTTDELHAFTKASRKRLREGREVEARRKKSQKESNKDARKKWEELLEKTMESYWL